MNSFKSTFGCMPLLVAISAILTASVTQAAEATAVETKARMIQLIDKLERDPFTKDGKEIRSEVVSWLTEAPDVSVSVCLAVLGGAKKLKGDDAGTLVVQLPFSEAKFILEHPDKAADLYAINVAGVEGVLRTYAAMKTTKPKLAIDEMDHLEQLRTSGQLDEVVGKRLAECS